MKPFDLEKALAGEAVITRSGSLVELQSYDIQNKIIKGIISSNSTCHWYIDGKMSHISSCGESLYDLFMAPKRVKRYIGVYNRSDSNQPVIPATDAFLCKDELIANCKLLIDVKVQIIEIETDE